MIRSPLKMLLVSADLALPLAGAAVAPAACENEVILAAGKLFPAGGRNR
jgi:hypothetical protein